MIRKTEVLRVQIAPDVRLSKENFLTAQCPQKTHGRAHVPRVCPTGPLFVKEGLRA